MKKNTLPFFLSILLLLSLILAACAGTATQTPQVGTVTAEPVSDIVTAEPGSDIVTAEGKLLPAPAVELAFAQGGVVAEVLVKPGDKVATGDVLALLVGVKAVQAELAAAQAQYDQTYSAALAAQEKSKRTQDWYKTQSSDFTLPLWYYSQQEQISAAQAAVDVAEGALVKAQKKLATLTQTTGADFAKAETDLAAAQAKYQVAKNLNDRIEKGKDIDDLTHRQLLLLQRDAELQKKGVAPRWVTVNKVNKDLRDEAQDIFDHAKSALRDAQDAYGDAVSIDGAKDVLKARAQASIAQERYYTALDYMRILQTGSESQDVTAAMNAVDQAKAALELYELRAPFSGTVLSFDLSAGEAASPGAPVAFLADTAIWTVVTKDLAEIDIVRIALGQSVTVKLDALPEEEFPGKVTAIDPVGKEHLGDMIYQVTITHNQVDLRFLWNMTATVNIKVK